MCQPCYEMCSQETCACFSCADVNFCNGCLLSSNGWPSGRPCVGYIPKSEYDKLIRIDRVADFG